MVDSNTPTPKVSNRISPLAIIIAMALIAFVVIAFLKVEGHHTSGTGVKAPIAQSGGGEPVMPQQSHVQNTQQPSAKTNDAMEAAPDTDKEPGGVAAHSGQTKSNSSGG